MLKEKLFLTAEIRLLLDPKKFGFTFKRLKFHDGRDRTHVRSFEPIFESFDL